MLKKENEESLAALPLSYTSQFLKGFQKKRKFKVTFCDQGTTLWISPTLPWDLWGTEKQHPHLSLSPPDFLDTLAWSDMEATEQKVSTRKWP